MKTKKIVEYTVKKEQTDKVFCDICKTEIKEGEYEVNDTTVCMDIGSLYPEGGSGEKTEYDICAGCFKTHLMPAMELFGAKPTVSEWEY